MKKTLLIAALSLSCSGIFAQAIEGKDLQEIQASFKKDTPTRALQNILTADKNLKGNALNRELQGKIDHFFKYRVNVKGITDQHSSGRCWMFTSMNVLRPEVMQKYNLDKFDFSHNYTYFWDIFEKSNLFLENIISTAGKDMEDREVCEYFKSPVGDGGVWNLYYNVAQKYGVVPQEVMPETAHSDNTSQMVNIINEKLRLGGYELREMAAAGKSAKELRNTKKEVLKDVYRILALCLGEPPHSFTWRFKDKDGNIKRLNNYFVKFAVEGEARIVGGSDIMANPRPVVWGTAPVLLRSTTRPGKIKVTASVLKAGLEMPLSAELVIESRKESMPMLWNEDERLAGEKQNVIRNKDLIPQGNEKLLRENELLKRELNRYRLREVENQQDEFGETAQSSFNISRLKYYL